MLPVLLGKPLMLMPAHIMFLELIIGPACSIFFEAEAEDENIMQRPPRKANEALFSGLRLALSLLQGVAALTEQKIKLALQMVGAVPVRGTEYFSDEYLALIDNEIDNWVPLAA